MSDKKNINKTTLVLRIIGGCLVAAVLVYYLLVAAAHTTTVVGDPNGEVMEKIREKNQYQY